MHTSSVKGRSLLAPNPHKNSGSVGTRCSCDGQTNHNQNKLLQGLSALRVRGLVPSHQAPNTRGVGRHFIRMAPILQRLLKTIRLKQKRRRQGEDWHQSTDLSNNKTGPLSTMKRNGGYVLSNTSRFALATSLAFLRSVTSGQMDEGRQVHYSLSTFFGWGGDIHTASAKKMCQKSSPKPQQLTGRRCGKSSTGPGSPGLCFLKRVRTVSPRWFAHSIRLRYAPCCYSAGRASLLPFQWLQLQRGGFFGFQPPADSLSPPHRRTCQ